MGYSKVIHLRVTPAEFEEIKRRAGREPLSAFARRMILNADHLPLVPQYPEGGRPTRTVLDARPVKSSAPLWKNKGKKSLV